MSKKKRRRILWTQAEDDALLASVESYGRKNWKKIAKQVKGRTGKQCRERFLNHISPYINKSAWTEEEDQILIAAHLKIGNKWTKLAKLLPGRSENNIKNRWNSSLKKIRFRKDQEVTKIIFKNEPYEEFNNSDVKHSIIEKHFCDDSGYCNNDSPCKEESKQFYKEPKVENVICYSGTNNAGFQNSSNLFQIPDLDRSDYKISQCLPFNKEKSFQESDNIHSSPPSFGNKTPKHLKYCVTTSPLKQNENTPELLLSTPQNSYSNSLDKNCLSINLKQEFGTPETPTPVKKIIYKIRKKEERKKSSFPEKSSQEDSAFEDNSIGINASFDFSQSFFDKYFNLSPQNSNYDFPINTNTPKDLNKVIISSRRISNSSYGTSKLLSPRINSKAKKRLSFSESTNCPELVSTSSSPDLLPFLDNIIFGRTPNQIILTKLAHDFLKSDSQKNYNY